MKPIGKGWIRIVALALVLAGIVTASRVLPVGAWLEALNTWVAGAGALGWIVFVGVYVLASVFALPASVLTIGAGFAFGVFHGFALVSAGSTIGAAAAFLVSRHFARDAIRRRFAHGEKFAAIDEAVAREGAKIVFMLRLSPVFPFVALNYLLGLTAVPFWRYVGASWLGMIPGTFLYVYLGHAGRAGLETAAGGADALRTTYTVVGLLVTLAVTIYVTRLARRALRRHAPVERPGPG